MGKSQSVLIFKKHKQGEKAEMTLSQKHLQRGEDSFPVNAGSPLGDLGLGAQERTFKQLPLQHSTW